jgi:hypothetical protein
MKRYFKLNLTRFYSCTGMNILFEPGCTSDVDSTWDADIGPTLQMISGRHRSYLKCLLGLYEIYFSLFVYNAFVCLYRKKGVLIVVQCLQDFLYILPS